jgi:hypothetical protein
VSGVGADANPCSRTAPCQTFAGAFSKTASGGIISVLDPGGYGTLTITKPITIDGGTGSGWASTLASGTNGFTVNITVAPVAPVKNKVILRNINIAGSSSTTLGLDGVRFLGSVAGTSLTLENVDIFDFSGDGIEVNRSVAGNLFLKNVRLSHAGTGIKIATSAGAINGAFEDVQISDMTSHGLHCQTATLTIAIRNFNSSRNGGNGIQSDGGSCQMSIQDSVIHGNNVGISAALGTLRIHNVTMTNNNTNLTSNVLTSGANRAAGNTTTNTPTAGAYTLQ